MFDQVAFIGVGLIGSSMARAIKERSLSKTLIGYDANNEVCTRIKELGIVNEAAPSLEVACKGADLIIISTPVGTAEKTLGAIASAAEKDAIIIDVGSVKGNVVDVAAKLASQGHIVPCHPISGTEKSGPDAGFGSLFEDRWCIITPLKRSDAPYLQSVEKTASLWRALGSNVEMMDAGHHDLALAVTSHLPHLIAFTLVGAADDLENVSESEIVKYSAGGFRDFTRIAASNPIMWRDVFLHNKDAVLEVLGRFTEELTVLQRAIRWGDAETLEASFARGRELRRAIVDAGQETEAANFGRDNETP